VSVTCSLWKPIMRDTLAAARLASSKSSYTTMHSGGACDLPRMITTVGLPSMRLYLQNCNVHPARPKLQAEERVCP
jgi:hypothetical protein